MSAIPAHRLGRYELLGRIATGGMGEIFLARLEGAAGFEKLFVVKRILPHLAGDPRFRSMLIDEATIASRMNHPNICQVNELDESGGSLYIVMEYLEGMSLLPILRRTSKQHRLLPLQLIANVIGQASDALHYAHELRDRDGSPLHIVHRDVTPSNIFVTEAGVAKILDFGIAKARTASAQTQTGTVKGKYAYMAPEQLRGAEIDRRVDVFALGIVLFEMLTLRRLFQRKTDYLTFQAVMEQPVPDVQGYRQDVAPALAHVLHTALARDANQRFATARDFNSALLDSLGTRPWSTSDVADFMRSNFSDVSKRRAASMSQVHQNESGAHGAGRASGSGLADLSDGHPQESDEDDGFPSIEIDGELPRVASLTASGDGLTPPPFAADNTNATGPGLRPLTPPPTVPAPQRNFTLPLIAGAALVVIAGAAGVFWWVNRNKPAPAAINIYQESRAYDAARAPAGSDAAGTSDAPFAVATTPDAALPPADAAPLAIADARPTKQDPKPTKPTSPADEQRMVKQVISQHSSKILACRTMLDLDQNRDLKKLAIVLKPGAAPVGTLLPASNNATRFGECVKKAVAKFPFAPVSTEYKLELEMTPTK